MRKTVNDLRSQTGSTIYPDYPGSLSKYAWLVESAILDVQRLYNPAPSHYCKACGEAVRRPDWEAHRDKHLQELGKRADSRSAAQKKVDKTPQLQIDFNWLQELYSLVGDSLDARIDSIEFDLPNPYELAERVVDQTVSIFNEGSAGESVFCADCRD